MGYPYHLFCLIAKHFYSKDRPDFYMLFTCFVIILPNISSQRFRFKLKPGIVCFLVDLDYAFAQSQD